MGEQSEDAAALAAWIDGQRDYLALLLDGWCVVDAQNRIVDCNPAFEDLAALPLRRLRKFARSCDGLAFDGCPARCPVHRVLETGESLRLDEVSGASTRGTDLKLIVATVPIRGPHGMVIGAAMTVRDVTAESTLLQKYDVTRKESIVDGLTGVYNRMYIDAQLAMAVRTYFRQMQPFAVVMCDLDRFKAINDTHSHQGGDLVLRAFANTITAVCRQTDLVGRFGGEEFLAILPKCTPPGVEVFCERLRRRTEALRLTFQGRPVSVTVSIGAACFDTTWPPTRDVVAYVEELVRRADQALYRAKETGRNRSVIYEVDIAQPSEVSAEKPSA